MKKAFMITLILIVLATTIVSGQDLLESIQGSWNLISIEINGDLKEVDNFLYQGTTYIPLRQVSEILGADVKYIPETKTAAITLDYKEGVEREFVGGTYYKFESNPEKGFYFPYYVYLPRDYKKNDASFMVVESNNSGSSDNLIVHEGSVIYSVSNFSYGKKMAERLNMPFLMPVFVRPETNWSDYTHDLDRSSLLAKLTEDEKALMGNYEDIDQQLIAMIDDAISQLSTGDYQINDKILMTGYSASAKFANKFSLLHPERIQAMVIGGINAATMIPVDSYKGITLNYPNGTADYKEITGRDFDADAYADIKQMFIMGADDDNDVTLYRDGWDENEAQTWWNVMGKDMMGKRWTNLQAAYEKLNVQIQCHTYQGIGHSITDNLLDDTFLFLSKNLGDKFVEITAHVNGN